MVAMRPQGAKDAAAEAIQALARRQHGVVAVRQLKALGVSRAELRTRVAAGWLTRLHRGVYAVGPGAPSWRGRWLGAVLACGEGALLSHSSAAALWRIAPPTAGKVEVTVVGNGGRRPREGIRVHRSIALGDAERGREHGIPVTSPERTIVDLASTGVGGRRLERILDEAEFRKLLEPSAFTVATRPGERPLPVALRTVLEAHEAGSTLTRSELEERFLAVCVEHELTQPLVNAPLLGLTVDFLWPRAALVAELDGRAGHDTRRAFQDDRDRDSLLVAAGFRVMRFTWWDVECRPAVVAHRVQRALGPRG